MRLLGDSAKKEAREEGREEGKIEQAVRQSLRQIRRRFGEVSPEMETRIEQLSLEKLDLLAEAIFDFTVPEDLENWLESQRQSS